MMQVKSPAKLNLTLKIGQKLKSGHHKIESVMQTIDLYDNLTFEKLDRDEIVIESNNEGIINKDNLAYKAASLLKKEYGVKGGVKIHIEKNVPLGAGLGGASSNAACTLTALNSLWKLRVQPKKMNEHAISLGSDVPFFVEGGPSLVEGIGEKVKTITKYPKINAVIVNPGFQVATKWAYQTYDRNKAKLKREKHMAGKDFLKLMQKKDIEKMAGNLYNDFTPIILKKHKMLKDIQTLLKKFGSMNSSLSGSGPTIFGLFSSIYTAREAYFKLKDIYPFVYLTKTM